MNDSIFACPACGGDFSFVSAQGSVECKSCQTSYPLEQGVPRLFAMPGHAPKNDVTDRMKSFYEKTPFPNYDDIDSKWRLVEKAEKGLFAHLLNKQIRSGARILEAGCGTGQVSNYLGINAGREVYGADMCLNSLKLAQEFKEKNNIENVRFLQMNLFKPAFRPESFDLAICNGVLHHTSDPYGGFQSLLRLVRPGGFIIIGLYNTYGRIFTDLRRFLFRLSGKSLAFLDPYLRKNLSVAKKTAWFNDQYKNPHESKHTMDEVLKWFDENEVDFVRSIPQPSLSKPFGPEEKIFVPIPRESAPERLLVQLRLMLEGSTEGGLFMMIGRKSARKASNASAGGSRMTGPTR